MAGSLRPSRAVALLTLRLFSLLAGATLFGLVAATGFPPWNSGFAVLLGFLYGTAFLSGTGYRIVIALAQRRQVHAPASWSGASAGAGLMTALLALLAPAPAFVLCGAGSAMTIAYLAVKTGCCLSDCCQRPLRLFGREIGLRGFEIGMSLILLTCGGLALLLNRSDLSAVILIAGHPGLRLFSRHRRGRTGRGWPPLRQPGPEIAPLALCAALSLWQLRG